MYLAPVVEDGRNCLDFTVQDSGIGITPQQRERLFQPFSQGDDGISGVYGGTGLGLSICKHLVGLMGGTIDCSSAPGAGSHFTFRIVCVSVLAPEPIPPTNAAPEMPPRSLAYPTHADTPARILLVDDTEMNRQLVSLQLSKHGLRVDVAENGELALAALAREHYDMVLMDCMMPVMDGYQACRALREREARLALPRTPVVALTAGATDDDRRQCEQAGMDDYLSKPFSAAQLYAVVQRWLTQSGGSGC